MKGTYCEKVFYFDKHHITLDNSSKLLYTVNNKRRDDNEDNNQHVLNGSNI